MKIDLTNILKNADSTSSPKLDDAVEHESPSIVTPDCGMPSSEGKFEGIRLPYAVLSIQVSILDWEY